MNSVLAAGLSRTLTPDTLLLLQLNYEFSSYISEMSGLQLHIISSFWPTLQHSQVGHYTRQQCLWVALISTCGNELFYCSFVQVIFSPQNVSETPASISPIWDIWNEVTVYAKVAFSCQTWEQFCSLLFCLKDRCGRKKIWFSCFLQKDRLLL